uniref:ATP synthase F0 subunit 8 n=1 Tax=Dryinus sp. ZJUH_2016011 TaxID=2491175 RepID=A0A3Q8U9Y8_9HYME|nr:ATP synthase F0 subunit 8 [Dryinus sp. ZJUH_2016011]
MPQMSPLLWSILMINFLLMIMVIMSILYFMDLTKPKNFIKKCYKTYQKIVW